MEFRVLPRNEAKALSYKRLDKSCVFISITDPTESEVLFEQNEQIKAVLRLKFDDVIENSEPNAMSENDAERIVDFALRWKDEVELIVVHCEAGISRSAGVCAALMLWINHDDSVIYNSHQFHPNTLCKSLVLQELRRRDLR